MTLLEAFRLFGYTSVCSTVSKDELKKVYRKAMIKYHPDSPTGDADKATKCNKAYSMILNMLDELDKERRNSALGSVVILLVSELVDVYSGNSVKTVVNGMEVVINRGNIYKYKTLISFYWSSLTDNVSTVYNSVLPLNSSREYELNCTVECDNIDCVNNINIIIENVSKNVTVDKYGVLVKLKLDSDILVKLTVAKKLRELNKK